MMSRCYVFLEIDPDKEAQFITCCRNFITNYAVIVGFELGPVSCFKAHFKEYDFVFVFDHADLDKVACMFFELTTAFADYLLRTLTILGETPVGNSNIASLGRLLLLDVVPAKQTEFERQCEAQVMHNRWLLSNVFGPFDYVLELPGPGTEFGPAQQSDGAARGILDELLESGQSAGARHSLVRSYELISISHI